MKSRPVFLLGTVIAASISAAFAQETPPAFGGTVSLTGISTHVTSENRFRFAEYRDLDSGVTAGFDLRGQSNAWYYNLFGENLGRDDQFLQLRGGRYGVFKYSAYSDDVIHNYTFNAITPFSGVGSNSLTFPGTTASVNTLTWNRFDYSVQHKNLGGAVEAQAGVDSPLYFRVTANRKKSEGVKPLGAAGTSPGGPAYELPAPIDWTTTDVSGEVGYTSKMAHFSVNVLYSKFEDHNDFLSWRTPFVTTGANLESSTLAADSNLWRVGVNGMVKQLPMDSSLALRATYTKVTNSMPIAPTYLSIVGTTGFNRLTNPSSPTFEGEVVNKSLSAALNSHLSSALSSKVYWNWYERENNSTRVVFTPSGPGAGGTCDVPATGVVATTCSAEFLHYKKDNFGAELYYRLAKGHKLTVGLDYLDTERERVDFDRSKETKAFIEYKTSALEIADFRVKYQHLRRNSEFLEGNSTNVYERFFYRFDAAPLDRDQVKFVFDMTPAPLLDLGVELIAKRNKYRDTFLGRNRDTRREVAVSASYGDPNGLRLTAFADYERSQYDSTHFVGATTTFPATNAAGTAYLWESDVKDRNYLVGAAASWKMNERLSFVGSLIWQKADGAVDFATQSVASNPINIDRYDNFRKKTLNLRALYAVTKKLDVSVGAAYEKYDYTDIQMDDYLYNIRTGTNQSYLSGAYAFPNYKASIVYVTLAYRF